MCVNYTRLSGSLQELGCSGSFQSSRRGSCVGYSRRSHTVHSSAGGGQVFWSCNLHRAAQLVRATLHPLVAETGHAVELCQLFQDLFTQNIWRHLCNLKHRTRSCCWWRAGEGACSIFKTRPCFKVVARQRPDASVRQRLAAAAKRAHRSSRSIPSLVNPQLHLSLVHPGGGILSLLRPGIWVWVLVFFYRLIFPWFWLVCIIQRLCLSQKSGSHFGDDAPVLKDVLCGSELWGHCESDDTLGVNICRDEVHCAWPGQSPQQLLG